MTQKNPNPKVGRLVIVDDEAELMTALSEILIGQGYETAGFTSCAEALEMLKEQDYDLLLTDLMMPEMDGIELLRAALEIDPDIVGIIMTGQGTVQTAVEAMKTGAFDYILKPFKLNTLLPVLSRAMEVRYLRMENMQLRETLAMHELGKAIAFSYDLNLILNKVADAALQQCNADEVSIMLPSQDMKELYIAAMRGRSSEHMGEHIQIDQGIAGWVAQNRESVTLHGEVNDRRFTPIKPRADIRAAISMPMLTGGNLVGILNVNITHGRRPVTLGQIKALSILVNIVAPILENTNLYAQLRQAEEKYRNIFENAIEGVYQSTPDGAHITVNPAFARMFGYVSPQEMTAEVSDIQKQLYVNPEDRTRIQHLMETEGVVKAFEVERFRKNGGHFWVSLNARAIRDGKGNIQYYEGMMEDITHRKQAEKRQKLVNNVLETLNRPNEIINLIRDILLQLKEHTGIEAIGIRLRQGEDFPYYAANGFPLQFIEAENFLCARDDANVILRDSEGNPYLECMCGNIISGRTNPALPFFTEGGSFWTNGTTKLLASTSEEYRLARTRNRCNSTGYESVALIPLRSGNEIIGLLQLNDTRPDCFTEKKIHFFEGIGASIGIAVSRLRSVEALRESENKYRVLFEASAEGILIADLETKIFKYANPAICRMLGYTENELITMNVADIHQKDALQSVMVAFEAQASGEKILAEGLPCLRKDGTVLYADVNAVKIIIDGKAYNAGFFRDVTERRQAFDRLRKALGATVQSLAAVAEIRDPYTSGHQRRVAHLARAIAAEMGLLTDQIDGLQMASTIHDIGKISVPAEILSMPRKLTDIEFNLIKTHVQSGYEILKDIEFPWPIARMVLEHHERIDGSGYPNALTGDKLLMESRIIVVADVVEAMASHRPYRPALGLEKAIEEIAKNRDVLYDPVVADACLRLFRGKGYQL